MIRKLIAWLMGLFRKDAVVHHPVPMGDFALQDAALPEQGQLFPPPSPITRYPLSMRDLLFGADVRETEPKPEQARPPRYDELQRLRKRQKKLNRNFYKGASHV